MEGIRDFPGGFLRGWKSLEFNCTNCNCKNRTLQLKSFSVLFLCEIRERERERERERGTELFLNGHFFLIF